MSQVLYEHPAPTATSAAAVADLRHHIAAAAAAAAGPTIMAACSDSEPVEEPVVTGDVKSHHQHQSHSSHTTATHYVGLPYQDHNYGAPPPPTPPQSLPPVPVATAPVFNLPADTNGILDVEKPVAVPSLIQPDIPIVPPAPTLAEIPAEHEDEGETRCICNYEHDDGYMICCDRCGVWQHVECMGLDRNSIPDKYFCEKCQPRQIDRIKAHELQSKKRPFLINHSDSSTDSGEEETPASANTTYMALSNSPTSLTLTTAAKHKRLKKKKKRSKEKEHVDDKHHKKKKMKHSRKLSGKSDDTSSTINIMDEEARPPWSDTDEHHDRYEEAAFNQYSADIQHLIATHCQKQAPSINSIRQSKLRTLGQKAGFGKMGKSGVGLVATEDMKKNEFIIEYKGKVMLSEQLEKKLPFFNSFNPHVLMYSKFSKLDICIDANSYGTEARFVRRSCNPNAEVRHLFEDNTIHLSLYSLGSITKGSEVTIGFDYNFKTCTFPVRCACKKKNCGIKKFWQKHHSEDGRNHKANHHIEEFRNRSNSNPGSLSPNAIKKRTVSPLRLSLAAHNAQNTQSTPNGPVNGDDNKESTASKESNVQENQSTETQEPAEPVKKLTRDERKMEAIMKAIEKMEKTEKRRQQALERIAVSKQQQQEKEEANKEEESKSSDAAKKDGEVKGQSGKKDQQVLESEQGKSSSGAEQNATSAPQTAAKPRPNNRGRKKSAAPRRRSRVNSAASNTTATSSAEISSMDEESNSMVTTPTSGTTTTSTISSPNHQLLTTAPRTSGVTTATSLSCSISAVPSSLSDSNQPSMSSPIPGNSKHFKFPKTKKFFMNEWFNEKALEMSANKPLSIKTESLDMIAASISSPSTPTQLSKSTPFCSLKTNLEGSLSGSLGGSMGSAKKRWLRQAMCDNNMKSNPGSSGANSPVLNGTLSPHHPASPALSPNSSMNDMMMTPLKKRMLRHSIAEGRSSLSQSSTPPPVSEKSATAPSIPTADGKSDEPPRLTQVKTEVDQNGSNMPSRIELSFDGFDEEKKRSVPNPLPLPACKDYCKNSSVNSGLSVTIPADLDRSPITVTPADTQTPEKTVKSSQVKSGDNSVEQSVNVKERTSERTTDSEASSVDVKTELDSQEKESELPVQERTAKESSKPGDSSGSPVTNRQSPSGSTKGPSQTDIETPVRQPPPPGGSSSSAQIRLDFSLSELQGSLSSSDKSHGSLPDLHSSCASAPELRQPLVVDNKADLSHSASGATYFYWTPKKADVHGSNVYSTPPRTRWDKIRDEDPSKVNGELSSHARMRRLSGPVDFGRRPPSEQDGTTRKSSEGGGFTDDQFSGNTNLYTSFASPKKKTLMMRNSEALAQEQRQRLEASQSDSRTPLPHRTDSSVKDPTRNQVAGSHPSEPPTNSRLSPSSSSSSSSFSSNAPTLAPSWTSFQMSSPSAGNTPPSPPPPTLSPHRPHGGVSPAKSSPPAGSPVLSSPSKVILSSSSSSPAPGVPPTGASLSPAVASPPPGTSPVKKKVSLLEYRKRKTTAGKTSSSSTSATSTTTTTSSTSKTSASAPSTPIKPTVPTPTKTGLPTPTKTGLPTLPTLPIFNMKSKAVAEESTAKGRRLSLTSDAVQAITSLTSFLKDKDKLVKKRRPSTQDENWRSNKVAPSLRNEDPLQKLRKELDEKNKERDRERRDSHNSLKRPRSPEPPPPLPSKKPSSSHSSSHPPPAKKSSRDSGLRLQIPPPPPPKVKNESRSGDNSTERTPTKPHKSCSNLHRSPGSAGTPPVAGPGTPPVKKQGGIPGTPPVRANPASVPGTPPVMGNLAATPPVQARPNAMHTTYQQAPTQPYNANYAQPQQGAPQQPMQYQQHQQHPQQVQPQQQVPPPPPGVQQPPHHHHQQQPPPGMPHQQQHPPPPPPAPQQQYNYQGYQQQQSYQTPEKQGTASVIEQFTKFHNQQQQQQQPQQYQQNVFNQAYQQPPQNFQAAPQQPYQQQYAAGQQQQHATSNSYSPRQGGYYH